MTPRERLKKAGASLAKLGSGIEDIAETVNDAQAALVLSVLLPDLAPWVDRLQRTFARLHDETRREIEDQKAGDA